MHVHSYAEIYNLEKQKGTVGRVSIVEVLSPRIRRIRIESLAFHQRKWKRGDKIKVQLNSKWRTYTPARVNSSEGWMDLIVFVHGKGVGSNWAQTVQGGEIVRISKFSNSFPKIKGSPSWFVFLGDETTLGLATAIIEALDESVTIYGAIELEEKDSSSIYALDLPFDSAIRKKKHGRSLQKWIKNFSLPKGKGRIILSGETATVKTLKKMLEKKGFAKKNIVSKSYWRCKKVK
jgi:NADPH-dependent ferric siderophore reductase